MKNQKLAKDKLGRFPGLKESTDLSLKLLAPVNLA